MRALSISKYVLLSIAIAFVSFACETTNVHDRASETSATVVSLGGAAGQTQLHLDNTLTALEQVASSAKQDPKPAFNAFADSFDAFGRHLADLTRQRSALDTRASLWFSEFERQNANILDASLRRKGEQRLTEFRQKIADLSRQVDALMAQTLGLQAQLKDVRVFLGNDLTAPGIADVADRIAQHAKDGRKIAAALGQLSRSSGELADSLRAARQPPR